MKQFIIIYSSIRKSSKRNKTKKDKREIRPRGCNVYKFNAQYVRKASNEPL